MRERVLFTKVSLDECGRSSGVLHGERRSQDCGRVAHDTNSGTPGQDIATGLKNRLPGRAPDENGGPVHRPAIRYVDYFRLPY